MAPVIGYAIVGAVAGAAIAGCVAVIVSKIEGDDTARMKKNVRRAATGGAIAGATYGAGYGYGVWEAGSAASTSTAPAATSTEVGASEVISAESIGGTGSVTAEPGVLGATDTALTVNPELTAAANTSGSTTGASTAINTGSQGASSVGTTTSRETFFQAMQNSQNQVLKTQLVSGTLQAGLGSYSQRQSDKAAQEYADSTTAERLREAEKERKNRLAIANLPYQNRSTISAPGSRPGNPNVQPGGVLGNAPLVNRPVAEADRAQATTVTVNRPTPNTREILLNNRNNPEDDRYATATTV